MNNGYTWPVSTGSISSVFGDRRDNGSRSHAGVDVAAPVGTPVKSALAGTVSAVGYNSSRGSFIKIDHGGGITSIYQHLSRMAVQSGQKVAEGQEIALSGNSGVGSGPHLHFEFLQDGKAIDPMSFNAASVLQGVSETVNTNGILQLLKDNWIIIAGGLLLFAVLSK